MRQAARADLAEIVTAVRRVTVAASRLELVAATSHLAEGWRDRVDCLELAGGPGLERAVRRSAATLGVAIVWESPEQVIPLPDGWRERGRPVPADLAGSARLEVAHFDPCSVVLRLVARGDEADYVTALEYLRHGWVDIPRLEALMADMLPRMTSATLAQDPAEFRRKFKGLRQLVASQAARADAIGFTAAAWV